MQLLEWLADVLAQLINALSGLRPGKGKPPPLDLDAEAAVLSALILSQGDAYAEVRSFLKPEHFYSAQNGFIYQAVEDLLALGRSIDLVLVADRLRANHRLKSVGGTPYLAMLIDSTPAVTNIAAHAAIVCDHWCQRELILVCRTAMADSYAHREDPVVATTTVLTNVLAIRQEALLCQSTLPRKSGASHPAAIATPSRQAPTG